VDLTGRWVFCVAADANGKEEDRTGSGWMPFMVGGDNGGILHKKRRRRGLLDAEEEEEKGLAELEPTKKSKREPVEKLKMTGPFGVCMWGL
jgi:hypothetical protein